MNKRIVHKEEALNVTFIWDVDKARTNLHKHTVSFEEAVAVFGDPFSLTILDELHYDRYTGDKRRFITIGWSRKNKTLVVVHRDWHNMINIISARPASRAEIKSYEEGDEQAFLFVKNA